MKRANPSLPEKDQYSSKRMTRATAGDKEWKWQHYFGQFPQEVLDKIEMDETALFSVTVDKDADVISQIVRSIIPDYALVCDATACVGGNTISFAKVFRHVTSIELDPGRYEMLKKNVSLSGYGSHVNCVNMNFLNFKDQMAYSDFIFFDPPWGGEDYQESSSLDMYLSNIPIADVVLSLRGKVRYIGLKSPMNFRLTEFETRIQAKRLCYQKFTISRNKGTYWIFTLYEFQNEDNGGILHMLSPGINPTILSRFKTSQLTATQSPSHKESTMLSTIIQSNCKGIDVVFDLSASIGIQTVSFLSFNLFSSYFNMTNKPVELENNIHSFLPSLSKQPQVHFIHSSETISLKERILDMKTAMLSSSSYCCVYIDIYNELSLDQLKSLNQSSHLTLHKLPLEIDIQQCIEQCALLPQCQMVIIRIPKCLEERIIKALSCFTISIHHFSQNQIISSCSIKHSSSFLLIQSQYPSYSHHHQLSTLWKAEPPCHLRKQLNSIFSTVLADRPNTLTSLTQAIIQDPSLDDPSIWAITRKEYFNSFHLSSSSSTSSSIDHSTAIKLDRSIVRVYGNKMKYVDMVVPLGCRPQHILCLGGVDAHLAHDLAKMYNCTDKQQIIVFGEDDRRKEENRIDYCFIPYPTKQSTSFYEYREQVLITLQAALQAISEIDMIISCCPHDVPFFGSILSSVINKLSGDAVLIINDHSVENIAENVLLEIIHDFHRQVTSCHIASILNREELNQSKEVDQDDKCLYRSKEDWENQLKQFGLVRYVSEKNKALWNTNDPTNLLKSFWACFQYNGLRD